jgi:uncharacterized protein (DUF885 family)
MLFSSCNPVIERATADPLQPDIAERFESYLSKFLIDVFLTDPFYIHSSIQSSEELGIESDYPRTWNDPYRYPNDEELAADKEFIARFSEFDRQALPYELQIAYDTLAYDYALYDDAVEYFYYEEPLLPEVGDHVSLLLLLAEYEFRSERDIQDYLTYCSMLPEYFDSLIEFEREKASRGLFMRDSALDTVLWECRTIIDTAESNILLTTFDKKMSDVAFSLLIKSADEYSKENTSIISGIIIPAYENLVQELEKLRGKGVSASGLYGLPSGIEYAEYLLKTMGISDTEDNIIPRMDNTILETQLRLNELTTADPYIFDKSAGFGFRGKDGKGIVDLLLERGSEDFPALPAGYEYELEEIDESMDDLTRSAMYMIPQIDNKADNRIYINPAIYFYPAEAFTTLAHEGYPGHMLHFTTFMNEDIHPYRKLFYYQANYEGWAIYAELYATKYFDGEDTVKEYYRINQLLSLLIQARIEFGVCFEDWTDTEIADYGIRALGYEFTEPEYIYDFCVDNPLSYAPYVAGYLGVVDLRERFPEMSDLEFHTAFLQMGSVPFEIMERYLDEILG